MSKIFSLKIGGFIGASIFCLGSFLTIFITNVNQLPYTFGVLQGIGFGIMVPVSYSTLNFYFSRKRTTVMSICKTIQGFVLMWYPQLIEIRRPYSLTKLFLNKTTNAVAIFRPISKLTEKNVPILITSVNNVAM